MSSHTPDSPASPFAPTRWTLILRARGETPEAQAALGELCEAYYQPVLRFLRREGRGPQDAQDLTQGFFARLLEKNVLENVAPEKGMFRSFMLAALRNYAADQWDKARAEKRGGGQVFVSLDDHTAEALYLAEPDPSASPERIFEQRWALTLLAQAFSRLREECAAACKTLEFDHLKVFLSTPTSDGAYDTLAAQLGMPIETVAVKVYRLRQRYGELIRAEIGHTVDNPADIGEEMGHLFDAIGR